MDSNIIELDKTDNNDKLEYNSTLKMNQESYNPPPQPLYDLNQNNQIPQNQIQNYPENNYNQQFIQPTPPPVYNAPLGVKVEQNISYLPHKSITQPHTNIFLIKIIKDSIFSFSIPFLVAFFFLAIGTFFFITNKNIGLFCFLLIIFALIIFLGIYNCLELNNKYELILDDSHLTVINKAYCCRKNISLYDKNDLIGFNMRSRIEEYPGKRGKIIKVNVYDFILLLRNGRSEKIITAPISIFTKEETNYLLYYVNEYIKN